jgi:hypothetical protein
MCPLIRRINSKGLSATPASEPEWSMGNEMPPLPAAASKGVQHWPKKLDAFALLVHGGYPQLSRPLSYFSPPSADEVLLTTDDVPCR